MKKLVISGKSLITIIAIFTSPGLAWACDASGNPEAKIVRLGILSWSSIGSGAAFGILYFIKLVLAKKTHGKVEGIKKIKPILLLGTVLTFSGVLGLLLKKAWCF